MIALLTTSEAFAQQGQTFRYMAQLVSKQLDFEGVPVAHQTIDICVGAPTEEAIALAIANMHWLKSYSLVNYWIPKSGGPEF